MYRNLVLAFLAVTAIAATPTRAPILIELFTSEGCSSCPPADRLLAQLDSQAIILSEHVDYWDRLGWRDPYSSHANTLRQEMYARLFGTQGPYTPQMVIDGVVEFVGNDAQRAAKELESARAREKLPIELSRTAAGLQVDIAGSPKSGDIWLALADESGDQQVRAGENQGRTLHHVAILRSLTKIGALKKGAPFGRTVELPATPGRVVVFVQENGHGRVQGVAAL